MEMEVLVLVLVLMLVEELSAFCTADKLSISSYLMYIFVSWRRHLLPVTSPVEYILHIHIHDLHLSVC